MKNILCAFFAFTISASCTFISKNVTNSYESTLEKLVKFQGEQLPNISRLPQNYHEVEKERDYEFHSYRRDKNSEPYLLIKLNSKGAFISALYYPLLENVKLNKETFFKIVPAVDWVKNEYPLSADDRTLKTSYYSIQKNILLGIYEINDREIHFVQLGSQVEPAKLNDQFLF
jgi:hypothetical protein